VEAKREERRRDRRRETEQRERERERERGEIEQNKESANREREKERKERGGEKGEHLPFYRRPRNLYTRHSYTMGKREQIKCQDQHANLSREGHDSTPSPLEEPACVTRRPKNTAKEQHRRGDNNNNIIIHSFSTHHARQKHTIARENQNGATYHTENGRQSTYTQPHRKPIRYPIKRSTISHRIKLKMLTSMATKK
jgi:hypothetical protein